MNDAAFSKSEAFRFGWETAKGNIGFFIWVILAGYVLPTAINVAASGLFERHPFFGAVLWLASTLLSCILIMGILRIGLKFTDGEQPVFGDLFSCFPLIFKWILAYIVFSLIVIGGLILLVVPGVIWTIKYGFFSFFIIDREDIGPIEALKESSRITQESKGNLFLFGLIAYGVIVLGVICLFIGLFWAVPTVFVALTFVYRKLMAHADGSEPVAPPSHPRPGAQGDSSSPPSSEGSSS